MVDSSVGGRTPWDRRYSPASLGLPIEVTTLGDLRRSRLGDDLLLRPGRVFFHVAVICTSGEGLHEVDFAPVVLQPRRVVHIRPGQVHRWDLTHRYEATLAMFPDSSRFRASGCPIGPRWFDLNDIEWSQATLILDLIQRETELHRPPERRDRALAGALDLLVVNLGLDLPRNQETGHLPEPYSQLVNQIENDNDWSRSVIQRAERLGYSQRTLTRACIAATGRTAKETIDDRILLEAQRLLVDSDTAIANVAQQLGFSEPAHLA